MPKRTHDSYLIGVNCAATACAPISSALCAIPARHRILEFAVNPVGEFLWPLDVMLEGRRIRIRARSAAKLRRHRCCRRNGDGSPGTLVVALANEIAQYIIGADARGGRRIALNSMRDFRAARSLEEFQYYKTHPEIAASQLVTVTSGIASDVIAAMPMGAMTAQL